MTLPSPAHPSGCRCGGASLACDAEMLVGGTGIGYFVWNQWNNLSIADIIVAIGLIGLVGMVLDKGLGRLAQAVAWRE